MKKPYLAVGLLYLLGGGGVSISAVAATTDSSVTITVKQADSIGDVSSLWGPGGQLDNLLNKGDQVSVSASNVIPTSTEIAQLCGNSAATTSWQTALAVDYGHMESSIANCNLQFQCADSSKLAAATALDFSAVADKGGNFLTCTLTLP